MIKKKFKELNKFSQVVKELIAKKPEVLETKLGYAIKRFEEVSLTGPYKEYNSELGMVRIDFALTEKSNGAMIKDPTSPRGFQYDKSGLKSVIKAEENIEKEWENREIEVEPYIISKQNVPSDLTQEQLEVFAGLVIPADSIKEEKPSTTKKEVA